MKVTHDTTVRAVYFAFGDAPFDRHICLDDERGYDLATDGSLIGVEILLPRVGIVDLTGLPQASEIGQWLTRAGYAVRNTSLAADGTTNA
jgi:hypothetical protein